MCVCVCVCLCVCLWYLSTRVKTAYIYIYIYNVRKYNCNTMTDDVIFDLVKLGIFPDFILFKSIFFSSLKQIKI